MNIYIALCLICASAQCFENSSVISRKHYGLSFERCPEFIKSFRCMSACKSIGFQIFRVDQHCKCTCHELKTTTILPFFKWRTNGTTGSYPRTQSPSLYHIVGTLSPATEWAPPVPTTESPECVYLTTRNTTDDELEDNSTDAANGTANETESGEDGGENVTGETETTTESSDAGGGSDAGDAGVGSPDATGTTTTTEDPAAGSR